MPDRATFSADRRTLFGKKVKRLRREGIVPANIYGHNRPSTPIQINTLEFSRFVRKHAATTLIRLTLPDGASDTALIAHVEHDPRTGNILHVDFKHVEMGQPIHARIPVRIEGVAPAVKINDGVLLPLTDMIEVEALPTQLPEALTVDVSGLDQINAAVHVSDLRVPSGVKVLTDAAETVVKVEPPRVVELPEVAEAPAAEEAIIPPELAETPPEQAEPTL